MHERRKQEEEAAAAEIMYLFKYFYRDAWAPGNLFDGKTRVWMKVFNDLVKQGFIKRRKTALGYEYKWVAQYPVGL